VQLYLQYPAHSCDPRLRWQRCCCTLLYSCWQVSVLVCAAAAAVVAVQCCWSCHLLPGHRYGYLKCQQNIKGAQSQCFYDMRRVSRSTSHARRRCVCLHTRCTVYGHATCELQQGVRHLKTNRHSANYYQWACMCSCSGAHPHPVASLAAPHTCEIYLIFTVLSPRHQ
jgi:hypothetical protein